MYKYLGNTGLLMYDVLGLVSFFSLLIFNVLQLKQKTEFLSGPSRFVLKKIKKTSSKTVLIVVSVVELVIISVLQNAFVGPINSTFGDFARTGVNYFGTLFVVPVILAILCLVLRIDMYKQIDLITPSFCVALFFAKLGCFCHGCCRGIPWEHGLYNAESGIVEFPVQLVEAALALLIFVFIMFYRKRAKEGSLFPIYLITYSGTRFFSEFLRVENIRWMGLKTYQILCLIGILVGFIYLAIVYFDDVSEYLSRAKKFLFEKIEKILSATGIKKVNKRKGSKTTRYKGSKVKKNTKADAQKNSAEVKKNEKSKFSKIRMWVLVWGLGLVGQIGWNVESVWLNTFVYEKIDKNPSVITPMLILSALATTVVIFLFGTLSDRTGKRRNLISIGFIGWGILTIAVGFTQFLAKNFLMTAIVGVILGDMLVSFFASMSTDVGYSTWLTDIMNEKNRGQIGAAIATQCVLGSLLGNIIGSALIGNDNNYLRMFIVIGSFIAVVGLVSVFLFSKKDDVKPSVTGSFSQQFFKIFDVRMLLQRKELLLVNIAVAIFFMGFNTYFPYLGNYIIQYLGFTADQLGVIEAIPLVLAMVITVPATRFINNGKFLHVSVFSVISGIIGAFIIYPILPDSVDTSKAFDLRLFAAILLVGASYVVMLQSTKVWTKNLYPTAHKGQYEGIWAISYALIPMLVGSNLSEVIVKNTGENIFNELTGRYEYIPNGNIFLIGAVISVISIIPAILAVRYKKSDMISE